MVDPRADALIEAEEAHRVLPAPLVVGERLTDLLALLLLGIVGVASYGQARGMVLTGAGIMLAGLIVHPFEDAERELRAYRAFA